MEKGNTAMMLAPFIKGMQDAGAAVKLVYAAEAEVGPCACGTNHCWYKEPGVCCIDDGMQALYRELQEADLLVIATPVYSPLPGALQMVLNRMMALSEPVFTWKNGRTRAQLRPDVRLKKIAVMATCGWWEKANARLAVAIIKEMCEGMGIPYAGGLVRPHVDAVRIGGKLNLRAGKVMDAAYAAGRSLITEGRIRKEQSAAFSRPLVRKNAYMMLLNRMHKG